MSQAQRMIWDDPEAIVIREPTPSEAGLLGAKYWEPPAIPPKQPIVLSDRIGSDGLAVTAQEHGELGPLLVNADHNFMTEAEANAR